ncbi:hypothetical protein D3C80_1647820 [compost metagenome]
MDIVQVITIKSKRQLQRAIRLCSQILLLHCYGIACKCIICPFSQCISALSDAAEQGRLAQQLYLKSGWRSFVEDSLHRIDQIGNFHLQHIQQHEAA